MGILFHRRAERSSYTPPQAEGANCEQGVCVPEDPRQQFTELRSQRQEANIRKSNLPGQTDIPPPAPSVDDPSTKPIDTTPPNGRPRIGGDRPRTGESESASDTRTLDRPRPSDLYQYSNTDDPRTREIGPASDIRATNSARPVDLYQYSNTDGPRDSAQRLVPGQNNQEQRTRPGHLPPLTLSETADAPTPGRAHSNREVPPPPLPDPELMGPPRRTVPPPPIPDSELMGAPRRDVPPPPLPALDLQNSRPRDLYQYNSDTTTHLPPVRDVPPSPRQPHRELQNSTEPVNQEESDHPGPGSRRRRALRERLSDPDHQTPAYREPREGAAANAMQRLELTPRPIERANPADRSNAPLDRTQGPLDRTNPRVENQPPLPRPGDGRVTDISAAQLKNLIANSDRPILVDIWQQNCGGCEAIAPTMNSLAAQYKGQASVYRVHVSEIQNDPQLRNQFKFRAVPTTLMFDNGSLINQHTGAEPPNFYASKLNGAIANHRQDHSTNNSDTQRQHAAPPSNRDRVANDDNDDSGNRRHNRLDARLERIKEKLARFTHLSPREKEQAFSPTPAEQRTLDLINNERRRYRLPDVVHDPRLQIIASRHTDYQVQRGMTHTESTPGWQTVPQRMKQVGLDGWRENAASGAFSPETLVRMWMESPGHKAAILGTGNIAAVCIRNGKATFNLTTDPELQTRRG